MILLVLYWRFHLNYFVNINGSVVYQAYTISDCKRFFTRFKKLSEKNGQNITDAFIGMYNIELLEVSK